MKSNEKARLIKSDGSILSIDAFFDSKMIFVKDITLPIEKGDIIERILPSGISMKYTIILVNCYTSTPLAHYELEFQK